jgi:hypothetical protein
MTEDEEEEEEEEEEEDGERIGLIWKKGDSGTGE